MRSDESELEDAGDEEILEQMDELRDKLDDSIDRFNEDVKHVFDWHAYVRSAPLTSAGVAVAVGYLFAPAIRSRSRPQPDPTPPPSTNGGIFGALAALAVSAATRFALDYVTQMLSPSTPSAASENVQGASAP